MSTRVCKIDRIIVAIAIQVQAVDGVGIEVGGIVRRDESAPFGAVITGVAVVQAGIISTVIAIGTKTGILTEPYFGILILTSSRPTVKKKPPRSDDMGGITELSSISIYCAENY